MTDLTDEKLIELFKGGDVLAFETIYERYKKLIKSFSRSLFLVGGDEEDLNQEGTVGLFYAVNSYNQEKGKFFTYAFLCIKSRMLNAVSSDTANKHKALNLAVPFSSVEEFNSLSAFSPEDFLIGVENRSELVDKIKSVLSSFEIKVFDLFVEGHNYKEISKLLSKTPKSIDNAIQRIKEKTEQLRRNKWRI